MQSANVLQARSVRVKDMKTSKRPPHSAASSPYGDEPCALHVDRAAHDRAGSIVLKVKYSRKLGF